MQLLSVCVTLVYLVAMSALISFKITFFRLFQVFLQFLFLECTYTIDVIVEWRLRKQSTSSCMLEFIRHLNIRFISLHRLEVFWFCTSVVNRKRSLCVVFWSCFPLTLAFYFKLVFHKQYTPGVRKEPPSYYSCSLCGWRTLGKNRLVQQSYHPMIDTFHTPTFELALMIHLTPNFAWLNIYTLENLKAATVTQSEPLLGQNFLGRNCTDKKKKKWD